MNAKRLLMLGVALAAGAAAWAAEYEIIDLGVLPGHNFSRAMEVNDSGQVVGYGGIAGNSSSEHAFRYTDGAGLVDLGTLGGSMSRAYGINGTGQVAGYSLISNLPPRVRAFRYADGVGLQNLGDLGTGAGSYGYDINDAGQVVGHAFWNGYQFAVRYTDGQGLVPLGPLQPHSDFWYAYGVNSQGRGAGVKADSEVSRGFRTDAAWSSSQSLGNIGGEESWGYAINEAGHVAGTATTAGGAESHAFLKNGDMLDLGTLGGTSSSAYDIDNLDRVVGSSTTASAVDHAFLWTAARGMIDLNSLIDPGRGWELNMAHGISDRGYIVGWGLHDGIEHAYRLTPISLGDGPGEVHALRVVQYDRSAGQVTSSFGVACMAIDNSVEIGPLTVEGLSGYQYSHQVCNVGNAGVATFALPAESVYFLVVANDGVVEGSYGTGNGVERPEDAGPACNLPQDLTSRCDAD